MKKICLAFLLIFILLIATACGRQNNITPGFGRDDLYLNIGGARYSLGDNIDTVLAALGSDYEYSEAQSCDYDGLDKTFVYGLAQFYTYPLPEGDIVSEIYSDSPEAFSSKGIRVGMKKADVLAAYGENCEDTGYQLVYSLPDGSAGSLCFDLENDLVTAVYVTTLSY